MKTKKYHIIILIIIILICLFTWVGINVYKYYSSYENKKLEISTNEEKTEPSKISNFNDIENKIIDAIYNKLNVYKYFDQDNLETIEITKLISVGYYESEKNIRYIQVVYIPKCKDGTYSCDRLSTNLQYNYNVEGPFFFYIKIDMSNYEYIERIDTIAAHINSDWKQTDSKIQ